MAIKYEVNVDQNKIELNVQPPATKITEVKTKDFVLSLSRTGGQGAQGYSAYEIAVHEGFVGTEEEWIASLKGEQGDPYESAAAQAATEAARDAAIAAKNQAVASAAAADQSEASAQASAAGAMISEQHAATSEQNADVSAGQAAASESNAATSESNAAGSASAAATSAADALSSEQAANQSAIDSATSASAASASETSALTSKTQAETAATNAYQSASTAVIKADEAASSALSALSSSQTATIEAGIATTKANEASASATSASTSAATATTKANEASSSATNAAISAATATTKATEASTSATNAASSATSASNSAATATTKASEASTSAASALTSKNAAATSATNAATSATNAAASATTATNKAGEAANSATASATSATNANNSKVLAAGYADTASTSASQAATYRNQAQGYRDSAATHATNAATSATNSATYATAAQAAQQSAVQARDTAIQKANEASASAANAASSEIGAADSLAETEGLYVSFSEKYLGVFAVPPTTNNQGGPLPLGALFYHSLEDGYKLKIWDGVNWNIAALNASDAVLTFNGRKGTVVLTVTDIEDVLGYLPVDPADLPTDLNQFTDTTGLLFDRKYSSLTGVPVHLSQFENDTGFLNLTEVAATIDGHRVNQALEATGEPMGFPERLNSVIEFSETTRTFVIRPNTTGGSNSFKVWTKGVLRNIVEPKEVTIPNTTGLYYFYFDPDGNLQYRTTYFVWETDAMVAYVYWNATTQKAPFVADERHGVVLDWQTHEYLHRTRGAAFASGFGINNYTIGGSGALDAHAQLDLASGTFFDEDLQVDIVAAISPIPNTWEQHLVNIARIPMFYLQNGATWIRDNPTDFPLKQGTSRPQYNYQSNGNWLTGDISNGKYATTWLIATNNINYPIIGIIGQSQKDTLGDAEAVQWSELTLPNFPIFEFRPLYKLIFQGSETYTNSVHARIVTIQDLRILSAVATATMPTDHGLLSGLADDDHTQYLHLGIAREVTAVHNFPELTKFGNRTVEQTARQSISATGNLAYDPLTGVISMNEADPVFAISPAATITDPDIVAWDTAVQPSDIKAEFNITPSNSVTIGFNTIALDERAFLVVNQYLVLKSNVDNSDVAAGYVVSYDGTSFTLDVTQLSQSTNELDLKAIVSMPPTGDSLAEQLAIVYAIALG